MRGLDKILPVHGEVAAKLTEGALGWSLYFVTRAPSTASRSPSPQAGRI